MTTLFFLTCFSFFLYFVSEENYKKDREDEEEMEPRKRKIKPIQNEQQNKNDTEYVICLNNLYYDGAKFQKDIKKASRYNSARKANLDLYNIDEDYDEDDLYLRRVN